MQGFVITLLICSATMSALALLYIMITPLLATRYSEKGRYYTWLIIVIGLLIPFRPQWGNSIVRVNVASETATPVIRIGNGTPVKIPVLVGNIELSSVLHGITWWQFAAAIWLTCVIIFLAYHIIKHYYFVVMVKRWRENITDEQASALLQTLQSEMGISKKINLYRCSCIDTPMMIGFANPQILLPKTSFSRDELRLSSNTSLSTLNGKTCITIDIDLSAEYSDQENGERIAVGYYHNGIFTEISIGEVIPGTEFSFQAPDAGEYYLYLANYSACIQNLASVTVSPG